MENQVYNEAMNRAFSPEFSEDDARVILNHEYRNMEVISRHLHGEIDASVVKAIQKLGGEYENNHGIVRLPTRWMIETEEPRQAARR